MDPHTLTKPDKSTGRSILGDLFSKLTTRGVDQCWFVSSTGANALRELAERASQRKSFNGFRDDLSGKGSDGLRASFEKYIVPISTNWETAYEHLRQLQVALVDEATLTKQVEQHIAFLIYRPDMREFSEAEVRVLLGDFILDHLGSEIRQNAVWEYLSEFGYEQRDWATDSSVQSQVQCRNQDYLRTVEIDLINGARVPRAEAQGILDELADHGGSRLVLVSAPAGYGKSCVFAQAFVELDAQDPPVLVVRLDRHGDAHSTHDIGRQMELPRSPAIVLAGIANGGPCVLFVDQLDAVSQVSGRYPHLWEVFDGLCREAASYPNMRVVVACRDFDLENDHRLRKLKQPETVKHIQVPLLSIEDVDAALAAAGCESAPLDQRQKEILQTPLHLFLFLDGVEDPAEVAFRSIGELFDRFWKRKQKQVSARLGHESAWTTVVDKLCDGMSRDLALYVPAVEVDEWNDTVDAMLTEHVLVCEQNKIRFFHESFFDYGFARRFCASGKTLLDLLRSSEQHLFRRSQVRQILVFLRDHADGRYLEQLRAILANDDVRFHIKRMVFAWLGTLPNPTADEWGIIESLLSVPDCRRHALPPVRNSLPWFDRLNELGVISRWLASSDEDTVNSAIWLLTFDDVQKHRSEVAASLLSPYRCRDSDWNDRLRRYFSFGDAHHSRSIQELFLALLGDGVFEDPGSDSYRSWWHRLDKAGEESPLFLLEAITVWLDRRIAKAPASPDENLLSREDGDKFATKLINEVAQREPKAYVDEVLPRVLKILTLSETSSAYWLKLDAVWNFPWNGEPFCAKDALLVELTAAIENLAKDSPDEFEALAKELLETEWMTIIVLLLRAWSAHPSRFADECIAFLLSDVRRLDIGYGSWSGDGNGHAAISRESIQACLPFASQEHRKNLEKAVVEFLPDDEEGEYEGWTERLLLEAYGEDNLSADGLSRLAMLREKFPNQDTGIPPRQAGTARFVGSPIPEDATKQFTDEQWLAAMHEYDFGWDDLASRSRLEDELKGSAVELSRKLGPEARRNRRRFAALIKLMDDSIRPEYFISILEGICGIYANLSKDERKADEEDFNDLETDIRRAWRSTGRGNMTRQSRCFKTL